jgi:hypothetical protein
MKRFAVALLGLLVGAGLAEAARLPQPISLVQRRPRIVHQHAYLRGNRMTEADWGLRGSVLRSQPPFRPTHGVRAN